MDYVVESVRILREQLQSSPFAQHVHHHSNTPGSLAVSRRRLPWGWVCAELCSLIREFPSGLTDVVFLMELQNRWKEAEDEWRRGTTMQSNTISGICEMRSVSIDSVLDVVVQAVDSFESTNVRSVQLIDTSPIPPSSCPADGTRPPKTIYWLPHQKYYRFLPSPQPHPNPMTSDDATASTSTSTSSNSKGVSHCLSLEPGCRLRMTGCKVLQDWTNGKTVRLLPTEHCVFVGGKPSDVDANEHLASIGFIDTLSSVDPNRPPLRPLRLRAKVCAIGSATFVSDAIIAAPEINALAAEGHVRLSSPSAIPSQDPGVVFDDNRAIDHRKFCQVFLEEVDGSTPCRCRTTSTEGTTDFSGDNDVETHICNCGGRRFHLMLWEEQVVMSTMFQVGDYLGIDHPYLPFHYARWSSLPTVEIGSQSVLYVVEQQKETELISFSTQASDISLSFSSQAPQQSRQLGPDLDVWEAPRDEGGNIDMRFFPERLFVSSVRRRKLFNVSLLATIVSMEGIRMTLAGHDGPLSHQPRSTVLVFRVADATGEIDVHLHGDAMVEVASSFLEGQEVLLANGAISSDGADSYHIVMMESTHSRVHSLSMLPGVLTSPFLYDGRVVPLQTVVDARPGRGHGTSADESHQDEIPINCICRVRVKACQLSTSPVAGRRSAVGDIRAVHARCFRMGELCRKDDGGSVYCYCNFCKSATRDWEASPTVEWIISDGSCDGLLVNASHHAHLSVLSVTVREFEKAITSSSTSRLDALMKDIRGKVFLVSISKIASQSNGSSCLYRMNQAVTDRTNGRVHSVGGYRKEREPKAPQRRQEQHEQQEQEQQQQQQQEEEEQQQQQQQQQQRQEQEQQQQQVLGHQTSSSTARSQFRPIPIENQGMAVARNAAPPKRISTRAAVPVAADTHRRKRFCLKKGSGEGVAGKEPLHANASDAQRRGEHAVPPKAKPVVKQQSIASFFTPQ